MVRKLIRLEYLAALLALVYTYFSFNHNVWLFLALLFAPDIVIAFYKINSKVGEIAYNMIHTYTIPVILLAANHVLFNLAVIQAVCIIWMSHISMDRLVGYGLKYDNFKETHIQRL